MTYKTLFPEVFFPLTDIPSMSTIQRSVLAKTSNLLLFLIPDKDELEAISPTVNTPPPVADVSSDRERAKDTNDSVEEDSKMLDRSGCPSVVLDFDARSLAILDRPGLKIKSVSGCNFLFCFKEY